MSPEIVARPSLRLRGIRLVNRVVQWLSLAFLGEWALYGILRCPFVVPFVSCQNCPVLTCPGRAATTFWGVWAGLAGLALLFGRAFCGWICPGGLLNRLLSKSPVAGNPAPGMEKDLAAGKYVALILVVGFYFLAAQPRVAVPIRVGEFWTAIQQTFQFAPPLWLVRTGLVLLCLGACVLLAMAWCRFVCPMGGLLELVRPAAWFRVYKTDACNGCDRCRHVCHMDTRPDEHNCTNCGDCLDACPQDCIRLGHRPDEPGS